MTHRFEKKFKTIASGLAVLLLAGCALSFAQHVPLKEQHRASAGEPRSDRFGNLWVWRSSEGLHILSSNSSSETTIPGFFLQHKVSAAGTIILSSEQAVGGESERGDKAGLQLRWHSREGRLLGAYALARHDDDPLPQFAMSANGAYAMALEPATARTTFFSSAGLVLAQSFLFEHAPYSNERPAFLAASAKRFFVLSQASPATEQERFSPVLVCFSFEGEELWRRELPIGTAGPLALSPSGNRLIASRYQVETGTQNVKATWHAFDAEGKAMATGTGMFRAAVFSPEEEQIVFMDRGELRAFRLPAAEIAWRFALPERTEMFVALAAAAHTQTYFALAATSGFKENRFVYEEARMLELRANGSLKSATPPAPALVHPALAVSEDQQTLSLAAEGLLLRYEIGVQPQSQRKE